MLNISESPAKVRVPSLRLLQFTLLLSLPVLSGCSRQITLRSDDGAIRLAYNCSDIQPQMQTAEQLRVLAKYVRDTVSDAADHDRIVAIQSITEPFRSYDFRATEQAVVEYICQYGLQK